MKHHFTQKKWIFQYSLIISMTILLQACNSRLTAELQWDSKNQILMSKDNQVKLRAMQSRVFDTSDKHQLLLTSVATMQDLYFEIDVLNEKLGVVSGKKLIPHFNSNVDDPSYYNYKTNQLLLINSNFRTWQPFNYRKDLTRITVTVRSKETTRSLVRVSLQYNLKAIDDPELYQAFFKILEQSLFLSAETE